MKYSINKYLLLEAAQDVASTKSAHKTKVAEQYDSAIDTTHDTNKVERSKKLISEATSTATPNHFQRNAHIYGAGAGAAGALGAGYYSKEISDAVKNGYDKVSQHAQEAYNKVEPVVKQGYVDASQYTQDKYNNSVLPAVKSGMKNVNEYIDSKKDEVNKFIDDQKANFAFDQKQKELGSLKTDESLTSNGLDQSPGLPAPKDNVSNPADIMNQQANEAKDAQVTPETMTKLNDIISKNEEKVSAPASAPAESYSPTVAKLLSKIGIDNNNKSYQSQTGAYDNIMKNSPLNNPAQTPYEQELLKQYNKLSIKDGSFDKYKADHPQPEENGLLQSLKNAIKNKTNYLQD